MYSSLKKILFSLSNYYAVDARALSFMRIGIALIVIADLLIRCCDLTAHYTDQGLWPTLLIHNFGWQKGFWSLHALYGSYGWEAFLFLFQLLAALFLLLGYCTRVATIVVWLLTISLHNRNVFVLQSGDDLLRLVLLWGCFLPWGNYYSLDARRNKQQASSRLAGFAYLLLLASVYFFTSLLKYGTEWHREGSAVYYALSLGQLRLPGAGDWLYGFPGLMKLLTWLIFYTELIIPVLILWPSKKGYARWIAFMLIIILHTGIGLTLYVGLFFIISMVSALGLMPGFLMNKLEAAFKLKHNEAPPEKKEQPVLDLLANSLVVILMILCLVINLSGMKWFNYQLRREISATANAMRLNQYWGMFSPVVMKKDGWFVYYGIDSIGRQWDLRRNEDYVDFHQPAHIVSTYSSDRWRKLAENMQDDRFTFLHPLYCGYILRNWNAKHPEKKIVTLNLYYMQKESLPNYKSSVTEKRLFCVCIP